MSKKSSGIYDEGWVKKRQEEMSADGLHQQRHPNGKLFREWLVVCGKKEGVLREWHENGTLLLEQPMKHGLVHGVVKQWNPSGKFLGEYKMETGRGVIREWYDDGTLKLEMERLTESATRGKVYDDLGRAHEQFLWNGRSVSKKNFYERIAKQQRTR